MVLSEITKSRRAGVVQFGTAVCAYCAIGAKYWAVRARLSFYRVWLSEPALLTSVMVLVAWLSLRLQSGRARRLAPTAPCCTHVGAKLEPPRQGTGDRNNRWANKQKPAKRMRPTAPDQAAIDKATSNVASIIAAAADAAKASRDARAAARAPRMQAQKAKV